MTRSQQAVREVTLLTQDNCAWCDHAKKVLATIANDQPLTVTELDLHSPQGQRLTTENPVPFAPGILLDGKLVAFGRLSERALRRVLKNR